MCYPFYDYLILWWRRDLIDIEWQLAGKAVAVEIRLREARIQVLYLTAYLDLANGIILRFVVEYSKVLVGGGMVEKFR